MNAFLRVAHGPSQQRCAPVKLNVSNLIRPSDCERCRVYSFHKPQTLNPETPMPIPSTLNRSILLVLRPVVGPGLGCYLPIQPLPPTLWPSVRRPRPPPTVPACLPFTSTGVAPAPAPSPPRPGARPDRSSLDGTYNAHIAELRASVMKLQQENNDVRMQLGGCSL